MQSTRVTTSKAARRKTNDTRAGKRSTKTAHEGIQVARRRLETWTRGRIYVQGEEGEGGTQTETVVERRPPLCVIGVDLGRRKTGLAVSRGGFAPRPLAVVREPGWIALAKRIVVEAKKQEATHLVVGLPQPAPKLDWTDNANQADNGAIGFHTHQARDSGSQQNRAGRSKNTSQASYCKKFAHCLAQESRDAGMLVYLVDERYTSLDASSRMLVNGRKSAYIQDTLDAAAAAIIVERYFENPDAAIPVGRAKKVGKETRETSALTGASGTQETHLDKTQ